MGQKASILIWDQNLYSGDPGGLAVEGEVSVALHACLSALIFLEDSTGNPFATETPKLGADTNGADS